MTDAPRSPRDYSQLHALLEKQETFPHEYVHKLVGGNSERFNQCVARLEQEFPLLRLQSSRLSADGSYRSLTYLFMAESPGEVIRLIQASERIEDLRLIL